MAKGKQSGTTTQRTTRPGKRLGVKAFGGQAVSAGSIIVRQKGTKVHADRGVGVGRDHTLFAQRDGVVRFKVKRGKNVVGIEEQ